MAKRPEADHPREINIAMARLGWGRMVSRLTYAEILVLEAVRQWPGGRLQSHLAPDQRRVVDRAGIAGHLPQKGRLTKDVLATASEYLLSIGYLSRSPLVKGAVLRVTEAALRHFAQPPRPLGRSGAGVDPEGAIVYHHTRFERTGSDE